MQALPNFFIFVYSVFIFIEHCNFRHSIYLLYIIFDRTRVKRNAYLSIQSASGTFSF